MKRRLGVFLAAALLGGALAGCTSTDNAVTDSNGAQGGGTTTTTVDATDSLDTGSEEVNEFIGDGLNEATKLVVGYQPNEQFWIVEQSQHYLENILAEDGITVEWVEFAYGAPLAEALAAGSIDVGTSLGDTAYINAKANSADIQAIFPYPVSQSGIAIVLSEKSSQEIKTLEDLRGKKIAYLAGSLGEDFIVKQLATVGLTSDDVEYVNISSTENQFAALLGGDVDAVISTQPKSNVWISQNNGALLDYGESVKKLFSILPANTKFAEKNPEIVAKFVAARIQVSLYVQENLDEYRRKLRLCF